ncbi:hypothetical protein FF38_13443, partial [Lucilia cuprina]
QIAQEQRAHGHPIRYHPANPSLCKEVGQLGVVKVGDLELFKRLEPERQSHLGPTREVVRPPRNDHACTWRSLADEPADRAQRLPTHRLQVCRTAEPATWDDLVKSVEEEDAGSGAPSGDQPIGVIEADLLGVPAKDFGGSLKPGAVPKVDVDGKRGELPLLEFPTRSDLWPAINRSAIARIETASPVELSSSTWTFGVFTALHHSLMESADAYRMKALTFGLADGLDGRSLFCCRLLKSDKPPSPGLERISGLSSYTCKKLCQLLAIF